ncbi:hypothetical protein Tco_0788383 [Tanacetum coccineum]
MTNKKVAELDVEFIKYKAEEKASMDALEKKIDDGIEKLEVSIKAMKSIAPPTVLPPSPIAPLSALRHMTDKIEGLGNGRVIIQRDFDQLETEIQEARTQIDEFQRKQTGNDDEIVLARARTSTLEILIEDIQVRHRSDMKSLLDKIRELKNHKGGPPDY